MPCTVQDPNYDDCMALHTFWSAQAERPGANAATRTVAHAEAQNWLEVADTIERLRHAKRPTAVGPV